MSLKQIYTIPAKNSENLQNEQMSLDDEGQPMDHKHATSAKQFFSC